MKSSYLLCEPCQNLVNFIPYLYIKQIWLYLRREQIIWRLWLKLTASLILFPIFVNLKNQLFCEEASMCKGFIVVRDLLYFSNASHVFCYLYKLFMYFVTYMMLYKNVLKRYCLWNQIMFYFSLIILR